MAADDHSKAPSWPGWAAAAAGRRRFGLELQSPFAEYVVSNRKPIETRGYDLPTGLLSSDGRQVKIEILQSKKGEDGVSAIPNRVSIGSRSKGSSLKRIGWCTFTRSFRYTSRAQFEADANKHLVDPASKYGWSEERPMYGWVVGSRGGCASDEENVACTAVRRMRSLFELHMKPTILVTGASGMLGRALHRLLLSNSSSEYNVIGTGHSRLQVDHYPNYFSDTKAKAEPVELHHLNLLDFDATTKFLNKHRPDVIVHCAAERYPDAFETKLEESIKLNVESTKHLARECKRLASDSDTARPYLIYLSTSYVFDGGAVSGVHPPYQPQSKAHPINNYGKSKWEGECAVREILNASGAGGRGIIARVPLLYGEDCCDLSESPALEMMKVFLPSASQTTTKKKIDHWALRFPTSTEDVSQVLKLMIDRVLDDTLDGGTYHIASPYGATKYDLMKMQAKLLNILTERVDGRTEGNSGGPPKDSAPRPQCTQLDCTDTWKALGMEAFEFVSLQSGMERALRGFPQRFG
ncbi:hypothetical protein ACHAXT_009991 [Thalassiosira profunda]